MPKEAFNAAWLLGFYSACKIRGTPLWIDTDALRRHAKTAAQISEGGAFNPLDVWAMNDFFLTLTKEIAAHA